MTNGDGLRAGPDPRAAGQIFVSYSRRDSAYVKQLVAFLYDAGLDVWVDDQIATGERWDRKLRTQIDGCAALILVMTPDAEESPWVAEEIDRARAKGKPILPLLLAGEVFFGFSRTQYDDVRAGEMPPDPFVDRLRSLVGATEPPSTVEHSDVDPTPLILEGHAGQVTTVAYSPDGSQLASGGSDGTVRLWHAATGGALTVLPGQREGTAIWSVAYSPDGQLVVSGATHGLGVVWDLRTGTVIASLPGHAAPIRAVAFSPDGRQIVTGGEDGIVRLFEPDGRPTGMLAPHVQTAYSSAYSPNGQHLATGDAERVRLWDAATMAPMAVLGGDAHIATSLAWSPDGRHLASAGDDGTARVFQVSSGELIRAFPGHSGRLYSVAYAPDGAHLATGGLTGAVRLWRAAMGELANTLTGHRGRVFGVAYSPDGRHLATASGDRTVRIWPVA